MPLVIKLLASGLLVAGVLALPAGPSAAVPAIDRADRRGDVEVVGSGDAVAPAIVDSVDIRHLTVTHQRDGLRVVVRLARVLPIRTRWVQSLAFAAGTDLDHPKDAALMEATVNLQHVAGSRAFLSHLYDPSETDGEEEEPPTCHVSVTKAAHRVRLNIPYRCVPEGDGPVVAVLLVGDKRTLANAILAEDDMAVGLPGPFSAFRRALPAPFS